jgi:hypothetical protein
MLGPLYIASGFASTYFMGVGSIACLFEALLIGYIDVFHTGKKTATTWGKVS